MAVRRKSNWYIYFISFGITLAMIIMVVLSLKDLIFPQSKETGLNTNGTLAEDFVPDQSMNLSVMTMISDADDDLPSLFIAVVYDAVENRMTYIPVTEGIALQSAGRTLPNIYAAQGGTVITAYGDGGWHGGFGNYIIIDHGGELSTVYAHCSAVTVSVGQTVNKGDVIGYVGSTGWSTGNHLHFETRVNGTAVDPFSYSYEFV